MDKTRQQKKRTKKGGKKKTNTTPKYPALKFPCLKLSYREHVRLRPNMYLGKTGDGSSYDDGIYSLIKWIVKGAINEFICGFVKEIEIRVNYEERKFGIRDHGRGLPLNELVEILSGDIPIRPYNNWFKDSIENGRVLTIIMSTCFKVQSIQEGLTRTIEFFEGELTYDSGIIPSDNNDSGTLIEFVLDKKIFGNYNISCEHIKNLLWEFCHLNRGLTIHFNDQTYCSNGLSDLLKHELQYETLYPIIHIIDGNFEAAFTHVDYQDQAQYYSFVNCHRTICGGTHQKAFSESYVRIIKDYFKIHKIPNIKIQRGLVCALSVWMEQDMFDGCSRCKMVFPYIGPNNLDDSNDSPLLTTYVYRILKRHLNNYLRKHPKTANALLQKIKEK